VPPERAVGALPVGVRDETFVDSTRSTPANGAAPGAPNRTMVTTIWYPASGSGATPDVARGPYPLVVFAHGFAVGPRTYADLLAGWASAGYVVVAPALPLLNGAAPGGASHDDYNGPNFFDVDFVLRDSLRRAATTGDVLSGMIDGSRIAVAGHSDGEVIAYALGFMACCRDVQVKAVIALAGDLSNAQALPLATGVPILHVISDNDEFDPVAGALAFDRQSLLAPKYTVVLRGASHLGPFAGRADTHFDLVLHASADFLDGTLKSGSGLTRLAAAVGAAPGLASLEAVPK
jgi:dienelactone hydrolase